MLPLLLVALLAAGGGWLAMRARDGAAPTTSGTEAVAACDIPPEILQPVWNGFYKGRSGDVLAIQRLPHQFGSRHSTPYPYTQDVPLVLYGPGFVKQGVTVQRPATVADLAPTQAELLGFDDFPERDGRVLKEALLPEERRNGAPRLIFTLVWDGGGDNLLEQWPDHWPNLARIMSEGVSYENATVGSSPSITPAIHATIGTGAFPRKHGLSDIRMRVDGEMVDAWEDTSPRLLEIDTLGDLWDAANGNVPLVGMEARDAWHLGMIGHGAFLPGADHDLAVLDSLGKVSFHTNGRYYYIPDYMSSMDGLEAAVSEVDGRDGAADQRWLGNPIVPFDGLVRYTPAWSIFQTQRIIQLVENEGYGADDVSDLFYANYKATDLAGHHWDMTQPEERDNLAEQDAQLPVLIEALDRVVGPENYLLAITADHGMQPPVSVTKGWSIDTAEMTDDIERAFDHKTPNIPLVMSNRSYQLVLHHKEMRRNKATAEEIAAFVRDYRLGDNVEAGEELSAANEAKKDDRLFLTALTPEALQSALRCARARTRDGAREDAPSPRRSERNDEEPIARSGAPASVRSAAAPPHLSGQMSERHPGRKDSH